MIKQFVVGFRYSLVLMAVMTLTGCAATGGFAKPEVKYREFEPSAFTLSYKVSKLSSESPVDAWHAEATKICQSEDYYFKFVADSKENNPDFFASAANGYLYCNSLFIDSRRQEPDAAYEQYTRLDNRAFQAKDPLQITERMLAGDYRSLEDMLSQAVHAYKTGEIDEEALGLIFSAFSRINPGLEPYFEKWLAQYPNSAPAHHAAARYYYFYAWFRRGSGWTKNLTEQQKKALQYYMAKASMEAEKALELDDSVSLYYANKINLLNRSGGSSKEVDELFNQVITRFPASMEIRHVYFISLLPRWGGSEQAMQDFLQRCHKDWSQVPRIGEMDAAYWYEYADHLYFQGKNEEALKLYDKALEFGEYPLLHYQRAEVLAKLKYYYEAESSYRKALERSPYNNAFYEGYLSVLLKNQKPFDALMIAITLADLNNQLPYVFRIQGDMFYSLRRYQDALLAYQKAAVLAPNEPYFKFLIRKAEFQLKVREGEKTATPAQAI